MQFQRNSQHEDRRRRVLTEELLGTADSTNRSKKGRQSVAARRARQAVYGTPAFATTYPRVSDLIPQRLSVLALLLLAGITAIAGLEALYVWMGDLAAMTTDGRVAAMDLDGEGSLAAWFSSLLLGLAAAVAWFIYRVRRHRQDDYHGRYRIWAWTAFCLVVMSIDEAGSLHEGFKELMTAATGERLFGDGSLWWVMAYALVLGIIGLRLLMQLKANFVATLSAFAAAALYVVAVFTQLGLVWPDRGAQAVMLEEGCEMGGNLLLLFALTLFARHVIFEAEGRLTERSKRRKASAGDRDSAQADAKSDSRPARTTTKRKATDLDNQKQPDAAPATVASRKKRRKQAAAVAEPDEQDRRLDEAHDAGNRKLSKKERKALRRQKQRLREQGLQ